MAREALEHALNDSKVQDEEEKLDWDARVPGGRDNSDEADEWLVGLQAKVNALSPTKEQQRDALKAEVPIPRTEERKTHESGREGQQSTGGESALKAAPESEQDPQPQSEFELAREPESEPVPDHEHESERAPAPAPAPASEGDPGAASTLASQP